jgi:hypothetical protein
MCNICFYCKWHLGTKFSNCLLLRVFKNYCLLYFYSYIWLLCWNWLLILITWISHQFVWIDYLYHLQIVKFSYHLPLSGLFLLSVWYLINNPFKYWLLYFSILTLKMLKFYYFAFKFYWEFIKSIVDMCWYGSLIPSL